LIDKANYTNAQYKYTKNTKYS